MADRDRKAGAQTLLKGLALLEAVARDIHDLDSLVEATGLTRSTAHRLLSTLVQAGYLRHTPREGYRLGPRLIELGFKAHHQLHLPSVARPFLRRLAEITHDTVHLGILDGTEIVYIDKVVGTRELQMASYIGARAPAQSTALGKALVSSLPREEWLDHFVPGLKRTPLTIDDPEAFVRELERTRERGYAVDWGENEEGIRCVGAPIRDGSGLGVAAISVSTAIMYMPEERVPEVARLVVEAAQAISRQLGWNDA